MSNQAEIPTDDAVSPGDALDKSPARPHPLWTGLYGLLLLGAIVSYFALLVLFAGALLRLSYFVIRLLGVGHHWWYMAALVLAAAMLAFLLIRTVRDLIYASAGLVTNLNDDVPEASEGVEVTRPEYPKLFQLLDDIGTAVGSPPPSEVRINHAPESFTVELRRFGIRPQRRLILVLSLPQLGVLSVAELGVILAHELSHFGGGYTRLVVFLDRFLNSLKRSIDAIGNRWWRWLDPIYWFQFGYLRALVLLSAPLQRYQELSADCVSATIYGGDFAARTLLKDWLLSNQFLTAISTYAPAENGEAPENIFGWFRERCWQNFSPAGEDYLLRRLEDEQRSTFWYDDPTIAERVRIMRTYPSNPNVSSKPARDLIVDLPALENRLHAMLMEE